MSPAGMWGIMSITLTKAKAIKGWMGDTELSWLATQAATHHRIVEVGCWLGRSTRALADNTPGQVIAVDHWEGPSDPKIKAECGWQEGDWERFVENCDDLIKRAKVIPFRLPSLEAAELFHRTERVVDMVFIDADHDYKNVYQDICAWWPLVEKGGLLAGHDYSLEWPGVVSAVDEVIGAAKRQRGPGSIWYWEVE